MSITETNTSNRSTTVNTPNNSSVVTTASRSTTVTPNRQTAVNSLAIVGFVALIVVGISLAIYSTRFVPGVVSRVGGAAVYLGSVFNSTPAPALTVVPTQTASSTIFFGAASSTTSTSTTTTTSITTTTKTPLKTIQTTAGANTNNTYQIGSGPATVAPYGLSDLTVYITEFGYLTTTSSDSFVAASTVPSGDRPAVKFTIKNIGTNWTGTWRFNASIPTQRAYTFESELQQSLAPGESIDYTLGFDQATTGSDQLISITANFDHAAIESNENNNNITAFFNVL